MSDYYSYNTFLQERFGCRVYKIAIDGGFSCPNRDGTKSNLGCIFCDARGSSALVHPPGTSIKEQVLKNIEVRKKRYGGKKFIVYFQSFTNTYASALHLKKLYDEAVFAHPDICGLSISTRSDCVDEEKLSLIASYKKHLPYVSIEYGLQTIHEKTLKRINRCETHQDFVKALALTTSFDIDSMVHVILGLPGETRADMLATADFIAKNPIKGVKIHMLVAAEGTPLGEMYLKKEWCPLTFDEYVSLACDFLERLPPTCAILRLSGNGHPDHLIAPHWIYDYKKAVVIAIQQELQKRHSKQGNFFT